MTANKLNGFWLIITLLLMLIILISSLVIWIRHDKGQPLIISQPPASPSISLISVDGAVVNPGTYTLRAGDDVSSLLQASGGAAENADLSRIRLYIPPRETGSRPQKIDINAADLWLLDALPGIGEVRAQAIIDYRHQNGPFGTIEDLTRVPGITNSTLEKIRNLITVGGP